MSQRELLALSQYHSSIATDKVVFGDGSRIKMIVSIAFAFGADGVTAGIFNETSSLQQDWASQASPGAGGALTDNAQVAVAHAFLQQLMTKYQNDLAFSTSINGTVVMLNGMFEETLPAGDPHVSGMRIGATAASGAVTKCKVRLSTDWSGSPLVFAAANSVGEPAVGFCIGLASVIRDQVAQKLAGDQFVSGSEHDFEFALGSQLANLHFIGTSSTIDDHYLSIYGNGAVNVR